MVDHDDEMNYSDAAKSPSLTFGFTVQQSPIKEIIFKNTVELASSGDLQCLLNSCPVYACALPRCVRRQMPMLVQGAFGGGGVRGRL